jgi:protein-S-isoprenylcysteine O-methyltransferase Ste14
MTEQVPSKGRVLPPVYFLTALIAMVALHYIVPGAQLFGWPFRYSGALLLIGGIALILWAAVLFQQAGTAIKPFQESSALVAGGPYRVTRNPMYVGMVGALLGVGVLLGSATPFLVVPTFAVLIDLHFIAAEEATLERVFGSTYIDYKSKVRRWL